MPNPFKGTKQMVNIKKKVYTMATNDGNSAEITMYGDIYEQQPTNWYGEAIEGQFITLSEFLSDLEQISGCKNITIRMDSYGGDAGASNTIHNRLRELARNGAALTCVVDGVAMSGGSLIMCACDTVKVNPSSLIMIHKCWTFLWGGYNADELRDQATQQDAWDKMQVEIYKRKCKLSDQELLQMMSETTCMTGREAAEKGFANEIIEDAESTNIAASADGRSLFVHGRQMHLAPGMFAPDNIPTVKSEAQAPAETNTNPPAQTGNEGGKIMAKDLIELRKEDPELFAQLMAEANARASASAGGGAPAPQASADAVSAAVQAEQKRLQEIDALAGVFDPETIKAAKYGEHPCTAQEMVYQAAQKAAQQGRNFLAALEADTAGSGAQDVGAANGASGDSTSGDSSPQAMLAQAKADARAFNERKKEVR